MCRAADQRRNITTWHTGLRARWQRRLVEGVGGRAVRRNPKADAAPTAAACHAGMAGRHPFQAKTGKLGTGKTYQIVADPGLYFAAPGTEMQPGRQCRIIGKATGRNLACRPPKADARLKLDPVGFVWRCHSGDQPVERISHSHPRLRPPSACTAAPSPLTHGPICRWCACWRRGCCERQNIGRQR